MGIARKLTGIIGVAATISIENATKAARNLQRADLIVPSIAEVVFTFVRFVSDEPTLHYLQHLWAITWSELKTVCS